jgi:hypothetical protein
MNTALDFARRVLALSGGEGIRRKAAARLLLSQGESEATATLESILQLARSGEPQAAAVLGPLLHALREEMSEDGQRLLHRVAVLSGHQQVEMVLSEGESAREYDEAAAARADARLFSDALGVLKQRARLSTNPDELAALAAASHPHVVRGLLLNPRLTESLVVRIAARRPARPEPLVEIWRSPKWSARLPVRRALVFNPYLPLKIGATIVPLLGAVDWRALVADGGVHQQLRSLADLLLTEKP